MIKEEKKYDVTMWSVLSNNKTYIQVDSTLHTYIVLTIISVHLALNSSVNSIFPLYILSLP